MRIIFLVTIAMLLFSCQEKTNQSTEAQQKHSTSTKKLPKQMKGYEFYSWKQGTEWYFCLITGTNRLKTAEEITPIEEKIEDRWVKITVKGVDKAKKVLQQLESGTSLFGSNLYRDQPVLDKKIQDELIKFTKNLKINLTF
ncbi:hypothetical protein [Candidatus Uabimicrobium sp. HlEnr_7]|uniref:hypothetical protein n=1 Tax=Candidatus Uabimicrobium helgolandensis TaxID=3095367 RepID=UPI003558EF4C